MASIIHAIATPNTSNDSGYYGSGSFTPNIDDLLLVFVIASDIIIETATVTSSANVLDPSLTFSLITTTFRGGGNDTLYAFIADRPITPTTAVLQSIFFNNTDSDWGTGSIIEVIRLSGINKVGYAAIKQFITARDQAANTLPQISFNTSVNPTNPVIIFVANGTNPATLNPPTNWSEGSDTGYTTPSIGCQYIYRNNGFSGSNVTWPSPVSTTTFGIIGLEINNGIEGSSYNKQLTSITGNAIGLSPDISVIISWLEISLYTGILISGTSNKQLTSITGNATGISQRLLISWIELDLGASSVGTSSKQLTSITGNAIGILQRIGTSNKQLTSITGSATGSLAVSAVILSWLEITAYTGTLITGTSDKELTILSGNTSGIHQQLFISWVEVEEGLSSIGNSIQQLTTINGNAAGSSPWRNISGTSSKQLTILTGSASAVLTKLILTWLRIDTILETFGNSDKELTTIIGTATGKVNYTIFGTSNKQLTSITGSAIGLYGTKTGTSSKQLTNLVSISIGKLFIKGTSSNKILTSLQSNNYIFLHSLRYYISPNRTVIKLSNSRTSNYSSAEQTYLYLSGNRTYSFISPIRNNNYITPNRIGT